MDMSIIMIKCYSKSSKSEELVKSCLWVLWIEHFLKPQIYDNIKFRFSLQSSELKKIDPNRKNGGSKEKEQLNQGSSIVDEKSMQGMNVIKSIVSFLIRLQRKAERLIFYFNRFSISKLVSPINILIYVPYCSWFVILKRFIQILHTTSFESLIYHSSMRPLKLMKRKTRIMLISI